MRSNVNPEDLLQHLPLDRVLALVVAHEDVRAMAGESELPPSWFDTMPVPTSPTVPDMRRAA